MSNASDKARFYLEQSVSELKEYERKKLFTADEITSIAKKRSEFEHKINARGSSPADYTRYAEFEINVDALRRKRVRRLGIRSTTHNGQRRIFFVFDRATRKFPGDVGLWLQSAAYAKKNKAYKKLSQILTNVLRMHPMKTELWVYAAQSAVEEHGDMTEARSYMQRGLRFCKTSKSLWLDYTKLELGYIAKITARRKILGIGQSPGSLPVADALDDATADVLHVPALTAEDLNPTESQHDEVDPSALQNLDSTPIMSGAIPIAIFDAAMSQFESDPSLAVDFYELAAEIDRIPCSMKILRYIDEVLANRANGSWQSRFCRIRVRLAAMSVSSPEFPRALGAALDELKSLVSEGQPPEELVIRSRRWLDTFLAQHELDYGLRRVIQSALVFVKSCTEAKVVE